MGCTGSKQARRDRRRSASPIPRSYSMPVHYPAQRKSDSCHVVALTSTTLGSLRLDSIREGCRHRGCPHCGVHDDDDEPMKKTLYDKKRSAAAGAPGSERFSEEVLKAKAWSEMIESRIPSPRTPTKTPPNEPEVINAWEMMAGLEDASPLYRFPATGGAMERSFSFHSVQETSRDVEPKPKPKLSNGSVSPEPMWMQVDGDGAGGDAIITEFDPDVISSFRKAFEEHSPKHPFHLPSQKSDEQEKLASAGVRRSPEFSGIVQARVSAFQGEIDARKALLGAAARPCGRPPAGEGKVVFYFTSLRGVRRTYEDCCTVRVILRGYAVRVDERDVSMHGGFKEELNTILGPGYGGAMLPRVFANGRYLGGAEEMRQMHDAGVLWEALDGCEEVAAGKIASCRACGDVRFVPCETCSGSCKVYVEEPEEGEEELDGEGGEEGVEPGGFRRCPDCNENGLVRCPVCCSS